jgi:hypothetical protein
VERSILPFRSDVFAFDQGFESHQIDSSDCNHNSGLQLTRESSERRIESDDES